MNKTDTKNGILIAFEGSDGSGKSTQVELLYNNLKNRGYRVKKYKFPTYGISGKLAYAYLKQEINSSALDGYQAASLYLVDMVCYAQEITDAMNNGMIVIIDRYVGSNYYQQAVRSLNTEAFSYALDLREFINNIQHMAFGLLHLPRPDITFHMDISSEFSKYLRDHDSNRTVKDFHEQDEAYLKKVINTSRLAANMDDWKSISCDFKSIEEISNDILKIFDQEVNNNATYFSFSYD